MAFGGCMRKILFVSALLALSGCASAFETFYQPLNNTQVTPVPGAHPTFYASTGDPNQDVYSMFSLGFAPIGHSDFTGGQVNTDAALSQGAKVGATAVVVSAKYLRTDSGIVPITMPTTNTTYVSGTVRSTTPSYRAATYSGTATTHGTETSYIPYSVDRYDQTAIYFAPLPKTGIGVLITPLTDADAQEAQTTVGGKVAAIRRGSPAAMADMIPGDIILSVSGTRYQIGHQEVFKENCSGRACEIVYLRRGEKRTVSLMLRPNGDWQ